GTASTFEALRPTAAARTQGIRFMSLSVEGSERPGSAEGAKARVRSRPWDSVVVWCSRGSLARLLRIQRGES
ncbi:hypothetical protein ACWGJW_37020, partial [Streptomyces nigrescens]